MKWCRYILFSLVLCCLSACTPRMVREAQDVVYEADSLRAAGQMYSDSTQIARACKTLEKAEWFYADDYMRSCYHYGRLLREKDDPVSAMQVFINASHSRSHDYHILGRVYSNMGTISQLAGEHSLSCSMYERSANHFLRANDSLAYYYALNEMAFELAKQGEDDKANTILKKLFSCPYPSVYDYACYTKIILLRNLHQYDSIIYYVDSIFAYKAQSSFASISKAQAFLHLEEYDSAAYYAQYTLDNSEELFEKDNAYYILIRCDSVKSAYNVYTLNSYRADVEKEIEIRHGKVAQAVQLLEQDIYNGSEWRGYVIIIFIVIALLAVTVIPFIWKKRKQHLQQQITQISNKHADSIVASIQKHIDVSDLNNTLHWKEYAAMKIEADLYMGGIVSKLEASNLNETEVRFCILTILDIRQKQIAEIIHYSYPSGIKTLKKRISDKLHTTPPELREHLLHKM